MWRNIARTVIFSGGSGIGSRYSMYYQFLSLERTPVLKMEEQTKLDNFHKSRKKVRWGEKLGPGPCYFHTLFLKNNLAV
jgi:hypothetical protein